MLKTAIFLGMAFSGLLSSTANAGVHFKVEGNRPVQLAVAFEHNGKWIKYGWNTIASGETRQLNSAVAGTILYFAKDQETQQDVGRTTDPFSGRRTTLPSSTRFVKEWSTVVESDGGDEHEFRVLRNSDNQTVVVGHPALSPEPLASPVDAKLPSVGSQAPGLESISFEWMLDADISAEASIKAEKKPAAKPETPGTPQRSPEAVQPANGPKPGKPTEVDKVPAPDATRTLNLYVE